MLPLAFHREAVRDLLGITRGLYRAERAKPTPDPSKLARLEQVGRQYRKALDLGARCAPDAFGRRVALSAAEEATAQLGAIVAEGQDHVAPVVAAAAERVRRRG